MHSQREEEEEGELEELEKLSLLQKQLMNTQTSKGVEEATQ